MRFRRHCYDKPWRCPGWAGGGFKYPKRNVCKGGSFAAEWNASVRQSWRWHRCRVCGTVALPHVTRWLDPTWLWFKLTVTFPRWLEYRRDLREIRKERKEWRERNDS